MNENTEIKPLNFDVICRTCLREDDNNMKSIFDDDLIEIPVYRMILSCSSTKVNSSDNLPKQICSECIDSVKQSYDFKQQCERSYNTLVALNGAEQNVEDLNSQHETHKDCSIQTEEVLFHMCEMCDSKFLSDEKLRAHRHEEHRDENQFFCRSCPKHYSRLNHLQRHIAYSHPDVSNIRFMKDNVCNICNKSFSRPDHLRRHIENVHRELVNYINIDQVSDDQQNADYDIDEKLNDDTGDNEQLIEAKVKNETSPIIDNSVKSVQYSIKTEKQESNDYNKTEEDVQCEVQLKEENSNDQENQEDEVHNNEDNLDDGAEDDENSDEEKYSRQVKLKTVKTGALVKPMTSKQGQKGRHHFKQEYSCDECNLKFTVRPKYAKHMEEVHNISKIFKCTTCEKTFGRATHLRRHELTHLDIKPYQCDQCEKRFSRLDHLNLHKHHHSDVKPHLCTMCGKGFARNEHLRKHIEARHTNKEPQPKNVFCDVCKKGFSTQKYLQIHMRMHTQKNWSCKYCNAEFDSKKDMHEHQKGHNNERPYLCSECGLRFVRNDYLVIHMRRHKGEKPYRCKYCNKGFPRATDLTVHERYHTGEKTHLCTICGKGFQRAYNLLVHTRVHTGERPYECPHCNKKFAQGNDLKAHVRRHTGERYKCDICGDGFIQGYHLTQHKRNMHGINMQSHIRRVEKFTTPIAQQMRMLEQQQQVQEDVPLQELKEIPSSSFVNVEMEPNVSIQVHDQTIKMEPQITFTEQPVIQHHLVHNQAQPHFIWSINPNIGQ